MINFAEMDQYAREIIEGKDRYKDLSKSCLPYLYYLRKKRGFCKIPIDEVEDLAQTAVSAAVTLQMQKDKPFSLLIHNCFRDVCRERMRIIREQYSGDICVKCHRAP